MANLNMTNRSRSTKYPTHDTCAYNKNYTVELCKRNTEKRYDELFLELAHFGWIVGGKEEWLTLWEIYRYFEVV